MSCMIYKKPGNIDIEELRCIHLFEADFNLAIGVIFGRKISTDLVGVRIVRKSGLPRAEGGSGEAQASVAAADFK